MKYVIIGLLMTLQPAEAQTCAPSSPEMAQYLSQNSWRQSVVRGPEGVEPVSGFVDARNAFYFQDLSRGGAAPAKFTVGTANKSRAEFFKFCQAGKGQYLRYMRRNREGNTYRLSMRYLPSLKEFANNPLADLKYKEHASSVRVKFEKGSTLDALESYPERVKAEFVEFVNGQLAAQTELGTVDLDLSGWDDVACDILRGTVKVWINKSGLSLAPTVTQKKEVEPHDVTAVYRALGEVLTASVSKEKAIFSASRVMARMELEGRIGNWGEQKSFAILKGLMNPDMSSLSALNSGDLYCVAEGQQAYSRGHVQHFINVQFQPPSLDEAELANGERQ